MVEIELMGAKQLLDDLGKTEQLLGVLVKAAKQGMHFWQGQLVKEQMSGRILPDFGLYRRTGNLVRNTASAAKVIGDTVYGGVMAGASYAKHHQTGTKKYPKRLYVIEDFAYSDTGGAQKIWQNVNEAVKKFYSKNAGMSFV